MFVLPDKLLPKIKHWGLSIEQSAVRGVEIDDASHAPKVFESVLPKDTFVDGQLRNTEALESAVKTVYISGKFSSPFVSVVIPEIYAFSRGLTVPHLMPDEIQEAISWRAKELFPFSEGEMFFDWRILDKQPKDYQIGVVAVAKNILDPILDTLIKSGLKPLRIEPDASALIRLLKLQAGFSAMIIEVNPHEAYVTLAQGDKSLFTTVVTYGSGETVEMYVTNILQSLQEVWQYYRSKGMLEDNKTPIYVSGELVSDQWISQIKTVVPAPVLPLNSTLQNPSYLKAYIAAASPVMPPQDPNSINLLPVIHQHRYDIERRTEYYTTLFARTIIAMIGVFFLTLTTFFLIRVQRERLDSQVKTLTEYTAIQRQDTQNLLLLNAKAKGIVALAPLRDTPDDEIAEFVSLVESGITVNQWEYDDSTLQFKVSGIAETREDLLQFRERLEDSQYFGGINLPLGSLESNANVQFAITFIKK